MKDINKSKRNTVILGIIIIVVMITSVAGIFTGNSSSTTSKFEYNGFKFYLGNQGWFTRIGNQQVIFNFMPNQVDNITLPKKINIDDQKLYMVICQNEQ